MLEHLYTPAYPLEDIMIYVEAPLYGGYYIGNGIFYEFNNCDSEKQQHKDFQKEYGEEHSYDFYKPKKCFKNEIIDHINARVEVLDFIPGYNCFDYTKHPKVNDIKTTDKQMIFDMLYNKLFFHLDKEDFEILDRIFQRTIPKDYYEMYMTKTCLHKGLEHRFSVEGYPLSGCKGLNHLMSYSKLCKKVNNLVLRNFVEKTKPHENNRFDYYGLNVLGIRKYLQDHTVEITTEMQNVWQNMIDSKDIHNLLLPD